MGYSELLEAYTDMAINEIEGYFRSRTKLPNLAKSIDECNEKFQLSDANLANTVQKIKTFLESKKVYRYGVNINTSTSEKCKLRSKCCSCPNNPLSHHDKNLERSKAERELKAWLSRAKEWKLDGMPDRSEEDKPFISKLTGAGKIKSKRPNY